MTNNTHKPASNIKLLKKIFLPTTTRHNEIPTHRATTYVRTYLTVRPLVEATR